MTRVFKYACPIADEVVISMPEAAHILTVQMQGDKPFLWAHVNPDTPKEDRLFRWYGTGHPIDRIGRYVGTVQLDGGSLVFHLFDLWPEVRA